MENWVWRLAEGILDVLIGFMFLANPGITAAVIPFMIGFWAFFYGIILLAGSFGSKKTGIDNWWLELLAGILTIFFGYLIAFNPLISILTITVMISISLLIVGIYNIILAFDLKKLMNAV